MNRSRVCSLLVVTLSLAVPSLFAQPPFQGPPRPVDPNDPNVILLQKLGKRPIRVHDPSTIVQCKDRYWLFYTGRATPSFYSKDLVTWERGPATFKTPPEWVAKAVPGNRSGLDFWAPDVRKVGNRYLLYFSVSTFGKNTSAIGLATNVTLDPCDPGYEWKDQGIVIQSDPNCDYNTIDPSVTEDEKGGLWLVFGSFWGGIKLIQLDPATGKRISPSSQIYPLAHYDSIEAPFIYLHDGVYYLFLNWGMCCRGMNSTYNMRIGRSIKITGPYLDKDGKDMLDGGGTLLLGTEGPFIGPGHAGILKQGDRTWISMHFYDGTQRGSSALAIRPLKWTADGWPVVE
jgi:arabinan endo-1,5-alpha-L-arabinosidase